MDKIIIVVLVLVVVAVLLGIGAYLYARFGLSSASSEGTVGGTVLTSSNLVVPSTTTSDPITTSIEGVQVYNVTVTYVDDQNEPASFQVEFIADASTPGLLEIETVAFSENVPTVEINARVLPNKILSVTVSNTGSTTLDILVRISFQ